MVAKVVTGYEDNIKVAFERSFKCRFSPVNP